ncbi:MFS transporter [Lentibacillus sediminis]|uniref:MFS transporter n=1 Tax=Lentibacillus sediminis TaxID=1940529 RepID=UPI00130424C2|nr:MFS transporter [Lentibacillus sediminis]
MIKRNMSLIVTNQFFTAIADSIFDLAILWYVYQLTDSALYASMVTAIVVLTGITAGPLIGVFIDRTTPKTSMQIGYCLMIFVGIMLSLVFMLWLDVLLMFIYVAIVIQNMCMVLINPALGKLLPRIVGESRIVRVNGYISSTGKTGDLIGQSISGFLIGLIGFAGVMLTHSGIYLLASILLMFVISIKKTSEGVEETAAASKTSGWFRELKDGFLTLYRNRPIFKMVLFATALNVTTVAGSLLVVLVIDRYGANAIQFGFMNAAGALMGIIIGLIASKIIHVAKPNIMLGSMNLLGGLAFIGMGMVTNLYIGTFFFLLMTFSSIIINIVFGSLLIILVKDEFRGRVMTLTSALASLLIPVVAVTGGYVADLFQVHYLFLFAGIWMIALGFFPLIDKDVRSIKELPEG